MTEKINYQLDGEFDPKEFFEWLNESLPEEEKIEIPTAESKG